VLYSFANGLGIFHVLVFLWHPSSSFFPLVHNWILELGLSTQNLQVEIGKDIEEDVLKNINSV
jgi:hypothetical protein